MYICTYMGIGLIFFFLRACAQKKRYGPYIHACTNVQIHSFLLPRKQYWTRDKSTMSHATLQAILDKGQIKEHRMNLSGS